MPGNDTAENSVPSSGTDEIQGDAGLESLVEDAGERARESSMAQLIAENFSIQDAIGGWRGLVESVLPGVVFVVVYVASPNLTLALILSAGVAVVATILRIIQRTPVTQAVAGLLGVAIAVAWAALSGRAANYFAWGFVLNVVYLVGILISIIVRWPVVGIVVGLLRGQGTSWRREPLIRRAYVRATWLWVGLFAVRLVVQLPMYQDDEVAALGVARIVMGVPLWAFTLWLTWMMVRKAKMPDAEVDSEVDSEVDGDGGVDANAGTTEDPSVATTRASTDSPEDG